MNNHELSQYRDVFLEELDEQLQIMDEELLRLEHDDQADNDESVQALFRAAHTIKGSSAAMGIEPIIRLTHDMEQLLDEVRNKRLAVSAELINTLFVQLDQLKTMQHELTHGDTGQPDQRHIMIDITIEPSCEMKYARCIIIYNKLIELVEIIQCTPSLDEELEDSMYGRMRVSCMTSMQDEQLIRYIEALMDIEQVEITEVHDQPTTGAQQGLAKASHSAASPTRKGSSSIRVNVTVLENLMNLVGELVIDQTRINRVKHNLLRKYRHDEDVEELEFVSDHVNRVVVDLQDNIMKARMIPIEQLFNRFPRMVRDLSQELDKKVNLILEGNETELDRSLIEEIGDPLIHLIRNALDHGIEHADVREKHGKSPEGQLIISAAHEDNQVVITVADDGAGIDVDRIKQRAIDLQLITSEEADRLTEQEALYLIFHAGFSTTQEVSDISGRGVGMDIVRADIERLNGLIDIQTERGKGTTFVIRLPLTLAIISGLLVNVAQQTFVLPMGNVDEIVRIAPEEVSMMHGEEVIMNRERVIPLVRLHDTFRLHHEPKAKKLPIVITGLAEKRVALAVDALIGNQEIVIKSLGHFIGKINCISGATILGDGKVAFILDVADIIALKR